MTLTNHLSQQLNSTHIQGVQWGFYQCEPDIWIVIAVDTQMVAIENNGSVHYYKHSPNGEGMVQDLQVWFWNKCKLLLNRSIACVR